MFVFSIYGEPTKEAADKFWSEIEEYKVNFLILDGRCYIYGKADELIEDILFNKVSDLGFVFSYERGCRDEQNQS